MPRAEWINIPEYSKRIGKTPQYIRRLVNNGKITETSLKQKGKRFLVNPKRADADLADNTSYVNKKPVVKQTGKGNKKKPVSNEEKKQTIEAAELDPKQTLAESQRQQALYTAALKKIELEEKQGDLLQKLDVEKEAFEIARRVRDAILNIPDRISAELASMTDTHLINDKLITEITQALEELSS